MCRSVAESFQEFVEGCFAQPRRLQYASSFARGLVVEGLEDRRLLTIGIDVGTHDIVAGQTATITVAVTASDPSNDDDVSDFVLTARIGDVSSSDPNPSVTPTPVFSAINFTRPGDNDLLFDDPAFTVTATGGPVSGFEHIAQASVSMNPPGFPPDINGSVTPIEADGDLVDLVIDTTGVAAGSSFSLNLCDVAVVVGQEDSQFASPGPNIIPVDGAAASCTNGTINIVSSSSTVEGRHIFYGESSYGRTVAPDIAPLTVGNMGAYANTSNYVHGLNGIAFDVSEIPNGNTIDENDFIFETSTDGSTWTTVATTPTIDPVIEDGGTNGSDRVEIIFPNGTIQNTWLRVQAISTDFGLAGNDVFAFGHLRGNITFGDTASQAQVLSNDAVVMINRFGQNTLIEDDDDVDRDGQMLSNDAVISINNFNATLTYITLPAPAPPQAPLQASLTEDVDGDGTVSSKDALLIINSLNASGDEAEGESDLSLDVSGNGFVGPEDALQVINYINRNVVARDIVLAEDLSDYDDDTDSLIADIL